MGAAMASGLLRVGMRRSRALEAERFDRAKRPHEDASLRFWQHVAPVVDPSAGDAYDRVRARGERVVPPAGCVLARRERPYAQLRALGVVVADLWANVYRGASDSAVYELLELGAGVASLSVGQRVVAPAIAGRRVPVVGRDLVVLRAPEYRCRASERDLESDVVWGGEWRLDEDGVPRWVRAAIDRDKVLARMEDRTNVPRVEADAPPPPPDDLEEALLCAKVRVRRASARPCTHRHWTREGRLDGCCCGGEIDAVVVE
jgi:hypothetical protein